LIIGEVVRLITTIGFLVVIGLWTVVVLTDKNSKKMLSNNKYLFWTSVVTVALIVLPLIWFAFAIPQSINSYRATPNSVGM
jgi:membrane-associated HD superfamily phosphohydrolase